ncbi:putative inorganic phosphate cotransporter isoform X2 [Sitodiplosis mosellana]|uniref:putative inorganic phosphate cotransporter isoform X2 n=1 Tax=Sitodiplosis mosellana TaxID=263140 RepID=UPI0024451789|nr:putative inorganic phosphate cotransporter isoform X2 [Sitodiplosis mosellana]
MVSSSLQQFITRCFIIPQRVVSALMAFSAVALAYMLRISLSYAITQMVIPPHAHENGSIITNPDVCPPYEDELVAIENNQPIPTVVSVTTDRYDWSQELQGLILSSFYWGYILTHVPGGLLSAKVGGKYTLLLGVVIATVFTVFTPMGISYGGSTVLIIFRIIIGMGEGIIFPSCNTLLAAWTPLKERSITATVVYSGGMLGSIFGSSISGLLISNYGWTSVFYWFGGAAIIWCIIFYFICYNNPESHPFITEKEKQYLTRELGELKRRDDLPSTPWRKLLTCPAVIALIFAQIGHNWGLFIIINDLPKYMNDVLRFSIKKNGLYTSVPYVVLWIVALFTGVLSDYLIKRKYLGITNSRKLFTSIAAIGPGVFVVLASYAGCDRVAVVAMFTLGMGFMGTFYSGIKANSLDIAPNYAGVIMAIANGTGSLAGVVGPYIVGVLTPNSYLTEWRIVFWITFVLFVVTTILYDIFASGEIQDWNDPLKLKEQNTKSNGSSSEKVNSVERTI